jgi:hypothetical protein
MKMSAKFNFCIIKCCVLNLQQISVLTEENYYKECSNELFYMSSLQKVYKVHECCVRPSIRRPVFHLQNY